VGSLEVNREKKKLQEKLVSRFFSSDLEEPKTKFIIFKIIIIIIIIHPKKNPPLVEKEGELEELGDDVLQRLREKKRKTTREER
jgi:hypothetical protein